MNPDNPAGDVAVVVRQSTDKQPESNPRQKEGLREFAEHLGWPFPTAPERFFETIGSGMAPRIHEIERLIRGIEAGVITKILIDEWSRATRSMLKACQLWEVITEHQVQLGVRAFGKIMDPTNEADFLLISLSGLLAEAQWFGLSRLVRGAMRRLAEQGHWLTRLAFGITRDEEGRLIWHRDQQADLLDQLTFGQLFGVRSACRILAARGLPLAPSTLYDRLQNPVYRTGHPLYGKTMMNFIRNEQAKLGEPPDRKPVAATEGPIRIQTTLGPFLPASFWEEYNEERELRRYNRDGGGHRGPDGPAFALAGRAKCACCGQWFRRHLTVKPRADGTRKLYEYVGCGTPRCPNRRLRLAFVEWRFVAGLKTLAREPALLKVMFAKSVARKKREMRQARSALHARQVELVQAIDRLAHAYPDRLAKDPAFAETMVELGAELARAHEQLLRVELALAWAERAHETEVAFLAWLQDVPARWKRLSRLDRAVLVRRAFRKILVGAGGRLTIQIRRSLHWPDDPSESPGRAPGTSDPDLTST